MVGGAVVDGRGQVVREARVVGAHGVILAYGRHVSGGSAFEFLIAGGGSAGCVLAARLSEAGRRVCLVEAGPGLRARPRRAQDILDARQLAFSHAWETEREDRSQLRARIIGGCSAHNACVVLAGAPADYDEWGEGWSYAVIARHLERAERELRVRRFGTRSSALAPASRTPQAPPRWSPVNDVGAVPEHGLRLPGLRARARGPYHPRRDAGRPGAVLRPPGGRVWRPATARCDADHVVLAAGAYGWPGILLRSDAAALRELPIGEGLTDHVGVVFAFEAHRPPAARGGGVRADVAALHGAGHDRGAQRRLRRGRVRPLHLPGARPARRRGLPGQRCRLRDEAMVARGPSA